jgi:hypothetical protein
MHPTAESCRLARTRLVEVTGTSADDWRCSTDPVTGMGEEFFFMHKDDENRFVYVCIEDRRVTATETN